MKNCFLIRSELQTKLVDGRTKEDLTSIAVNMKARFGYYLEYNDLEKEFTTLADFEFKSGSSFLEKLIQLPYMNRLPNNDKLIEKEMSFNAYKYDVSKYRKFYHQNQKHRLKKTATTSNIFHRYSYHSSLSSWHVA